MLTNTCRYYVLSAVCALFKYTEIRLNVRFATGSLRIRYVQADGTMMVDLETARNLELVGNATKKRSFHSLLGYDITNRNLVC
jgi:DNA mismatch repair protein MSH4